MSPSLRRLLAISLAFVAIAVPCSGSTAQSAERPALATLATLAGVVRDTGGKPRAGAEIFIPQLKRSVKADAAGSFLLDSVAPGAHEVWVRDLGYIVVQFEWPAQANNRLEVAITMRPLPNTLDPVVVWASEERSMKSNSVVQGFVVDSAGNPIEGADITLIGAGRTTVSAQDGSFAFRHVAPGELTLRSRLLGYSPASSQIRLAQADDRRVVLRMTPLSHQLDAVNVTARSGFGIVESLALKSFDHRMRLWQPNGKAVFWGEIDMARVGAMPMDLAVRGLPANAGGRGAPDLFARKSLPCKGSDCDACVLEDGIRARRQPLRSFTMSDFERMEYYPATPPETEFTGTVADRFQNVPGCEKANGKHPAWFVLWRKGGGT